MKYNIPTNTPIFLVKPDGSYVMNGENYQYFSGEAQAAANGYLTDAAGNFLLSSTGEYLLASQYAASDAAPVGDTVIAAPVAAALDTTPATTLVSQQTQQTSDSIQVPSNAHTPQNTHETTTAQTPANTQAPATVQTPATAQAPITTQTSATTQPPSNTQVNYAAHNFQATAAENTPGAVPVAPTTPQNFQPGAVNAATITTPAPQSKESAGLSIPVTIIILIAAAVAGAVSGALIFNIAFS